MKNRNKLYLWISIVSFAVMVGALAAMARLWMNYKQAEAEYAALAELAYAATEPEDADAAEPTEPEIIFDEEGKPVVLVDIPINFDLLQEKNRDIIGWITVAGTTIDYPVLYDTTESMYYLDHNFNGTATGYGSVFITGDNWWDFSDFLTVAYGHNMADGNMFAQLHKFRNQKFFEENGEIIVYTPKEKLTYQVFAAYRRDNKNILRVYDFSTEELRQAYIDEIYTYTDSALFKPQYSVTPADRILTLSTCVGNPANRFVVQGVLISAEPGRYTGKGA